jgi:hypothetical protein
MRISSFLVLLASVASTQATLNGPCDGGLGACVHTSTCNDHGGTIHNNLCPDDPNDVKCCTGWDAPKCQAKSGTCRFTDTCNTANHFIDSSRHSSPRTSTYSLTDCVQIYARVLTTTNAAFHALTFRGSSTGQLNWIRGLPLAQCDGIM